MYIIPITPFTLDLVAPLNGGVRPQMQQEPTYFLFSPNGFNTIVGEQEYKSLTGDRKFVTLSYIAG